MLLSKINPIWSLISWMSSSRCCTKRLLFDLNYSEKSRWALGKVSWPEQKEADVSHWGWWFGESKDCFGDYVSCTSPMKDRKLTKQVHHGQLLLLISVRCTDHPARNMLYQDRPTHFHWTSPRCSQGSQWCQATRFDVVAPIRSTRANEHHPPIGRYRREFQDYHERCRGQGWYRQAGLGEEGYVSWRSPVIELTIQRRCRKRLWGLLFHYTNCRIKVKRLNSMRLCSSSWVWRSGKSSRTTRYKVYGIKV